MGGQRDQWSTSEAQAEPEVTSEAQAEQDDHWGDWSSKSNSMMPTPPQEPHPFQPTPPQASPTFQHYNRQGHGTSAIPSAFPPLPPPSASYTSNKSSSEWLEPSSKATPAVPPRSASDTSQTR